MGHVHPDLAVDVRSGHRLRRRVVPPDGRPQAVHLQDDRLRRDVDEDHRQHPDRPSARLRPVVVGEPEQEGDAVRRQRPRASTTRWTMARTWTQFKDGPAAGAGELDHGRAALPRRRDLDLRPRPLHPAEHHAARADGADALRRPSTSAKLYEPAPIFRQARSVFTQAGPPALPARAADSARRAGRRWRSSTRAARSSARRRSSPHAGLNGINWDLRSTRRQLVELMTTPPDNPHIWEEPRFKDVEIRRITHWGITPQTGIPMAAPGKYQVRFTVDGTGATRSRSR